MNTTYLKFETLRLVRNRETFIFSLIFPLVIFYAIAGSNRNTEISTGLTFPRFYMAGMLAFGTLAAITGGGARIAVERDLGWNRQLRITPLSPRIYLTSKVLLSYLLAVISLVLIALAGVSLGVHLSATTWLQTLALTLIALIPFAALGLFIGHMFKGESIGPIMGGGISLFSIVGGAYFPLGGDSGVLHDLVRLVPSYWLVQAGKIGIGGQSWTIEAWLVIAVWSIVLGLAAAWAYRRDTKRA
jgi:ABC-2 type transport system permease protein